MPAIFLVISMLLGMNSSADVHEFHLSKTTINYDSEERAIQISTSVFIDDLELSLKELGHDSLKICTRREKENAQQLMHDYLKEHLVVKVDGVQLSLSFLGKEQSDDLAAVWCYLEVYDVPAFKEISISNTILTSVFDDQKNITMVQVDKDKIAHILFTADKTFEKVER